MVAGVTSGKSSCFSRGEDAGNDDVIGLGKRLREFRAEETRAGEQVRLEVTRILDCG